MPEEGLNRPDRVDRILPQRAPTLDLAEFKQASFYFDLIVEFVATLLFLYITVATIIGHKKQTGPCDGVGVLGVAWALGGTYFILVYCTAGISGGYINPAVTFALFNMKKMSLNRAVMYMIAQCLGAISGVGLAKACMKPNYDSLGGAANSVAPGYGMGAALGAEIVGSFLLVCTVLATIDPERRAHDSHVPVLGPLAIGFVVFVVHLATVPITGTGISINPASSLGAAVIYNNSKVWNDLIFFFFGPMLGAFAATAYNICILRLRDDLIAYPNNPTN